MGVKRRTRDRPVPGHDLEESVQTRTGSPRARFVNPWPPSGAPASVGQERREREPQQRRDRVPTSRHGPPRYWCDKPCGAWLGLEERYT